MHARLHLRQSAAALATALAAIGAGTFLAIHPAIAQDAYPSKPIRLVIGFPPGGAADTIARIYGEALSKELKQPVVVDNRPGAGTTIAADYVAKSPADGYTLYIGGASLMGGDNALYKNLRYTAGDFTPVTQLTTAPLLLVAGKASGIKTTADLLQKAKQSPGALNYSSSGNGVVTHLAGVHFVKMAHITMTHVPYKGGAQSGQAVAAGDAQVSFATPASVQPLIDAGKLTPIAVTSARRSTVMPNYPTIAESGVPGYELNNWYGLFVAKGTPAPIVQQLHSASVKVLREPAVRKQLASRGEEAAPSASPDAFRTFATREGKLNVDLIAQSGANID
ncbi:tripartite tricarboxylate transporter substrate binding protein [Cupriavidus pauculus]|uniref:Tripartite tricarboxylate transporter substrate binding protein n=1 Tax=Cupriavidus pauculus TaxID=82633 RepID=A0A5P2HET5_9BURK|nr:tripartite tricarboxylate transporter substrate binding protein [Cupriavidus pauculus]QET06328.1 tripartite tricarboxylate transporter substrate binding protein [Cupriavidus pauculus]